MLSWPYVNIQPTSNRQFLHSHLSYSSYSSAAYKRLVTMLDFMDYIQRAFFAASKWNIDNSYSSLNTTAEGTRSCNSCTSIIFDSNFATDILDFPTPKGVHVTISSLATPHFSTSYTLAL